MSKLLWSPLTDIEMRTLEDLVKHHKFPDCRDRARGLLALSDGKEPGDIAGILRMTKQSVYNWATWWNRKGLCGILNGHKGGCSPKLNGELVKMACGIAAQQPLTLAEIREQLMECYPGTPGFSIDCLSDHLRKNGFSFKRNRLSLKKTPRAGIHREAGHP